MCVCVCITSSIYLAMLDIVFLILVVVFSVECFVFVVTTDVCNDAVNVLSSPIVLNG